MHKARAFFLVCAGIFLLALAYHLGAVSVHAQVGATIDGADVTTVVGLPSGMRASGVVGRTFYSIDAGGNAIVQAHPVPGTARVIATDANAFMVMLENGDWLIANTSEASGWQLLGNLGASTAATRVTWGEVKAKYRPEGAATKDK
jgi:hypothetical protein